MNQGNPSLLGRTISSPHPWATRLSSSCKFSIQWLQNTLHQSSLLTKQFNNNYNYKCKILFKCHTLHLVTFLFGSVTFGFRHLINSRLLLSAAHPPPTTTTTNTTTTTTTTTTKLILLLVCNYDRQTIEINAKIGAAWIISNHRINHLASVKTVQGQCVWNTVTTVHWTL